MKHFTLDEAEDALIGKRGTMLREAYEKEKQDELSREEQKVLLVKHLFATPTDAQREEVRSDYCRYCSGTDDPCHCWNDE